jgi:hypothetical protein
MIASHGYKVSGITSNALYAVSLRAIGSNKMTPKEAKKIVRQYLDGENLPYSRLSATTISFSDLARCSEVLVLVHGWMSNPKWHDLVSLARRAGFTVDAR